MAREIARGDVLCEALLVSIQISIIMQASVLSFIASLLSCTLGLNITNSPQNITVCINDMAEINCGFTGVDPILIVPNWIIIMRSDNGSIVSNETVFGGEISANRISGFSWEPDVDSGTDNAPNSILLFGPIKKTHNQSSFQCFFINSRNQIVGTSRIGTITVIGPPSVNITIDEVCITSITLSLTIYSHSACGAFPLVNLMSSNGVILPVSNNDYTYTFNGLAANISYNVTITVIYNNGTSDFQVFSKLIKTHSSSTPRPVNVSTIETLTSNNGDVIIYWKEPNSDACLISEVKFYDVNIRCDDGKSFSKEAGNTMIIFSPSDLLNNESDISCMITIVVHNSEDMSSQPSSKTFVILGIENNTRDDMNNSHSEESNEGDKLHENENDEIYCEILIGLISLLAALFVIAIVIIVVLFYKLYFQRNKKEGETVPPQPVVQHLNVDNIEMQSSPAYVPLDSKVSSAIAETEYEIPVVHTHVN